MSADNWARCPRCVARDAADIEVRSAAVDKAYGSVSVAEFDEMREALAASRTHHDEYNSFRTFREDYEIYGAEEGEVTVSYRGGCSTCGLRLEFEHAHTLDVGGAS